MLMYIYTLGQGMTRFTGGNCFSSLFLAQATSPVYYRSRTPIYVGSVTGIFYHSGIAQECLCT